MKTAPRSTPTPEEQTYTATCAAYRAAADAFLPVARAYSEAQRAYQEADRTLAAAFRAYQAYQEAERTSKPPPTATLAVIREAYRGTQGAYTDDDQLDARAAERARGALAEAERGALAEAELLAREALAAARHGEPGTAGYFPAAAYSRLYFTIHDVIGRDE